MTDDLSRREMFRWIAGITLAGCGGTSSSTTTPDAAPGTCARIPAETAGPYPGDGTNGPNALALPGINRSDIRTSLGNASGTAAGIELKVTLTIVNTTCEPLAGKVVYIWHCDRAGDYSMYTGNAQSENYLRGVQMTDANGQVTFTTIFPGCYVGRWPHFHVEIDDTVSQLALPEAICDEVYATPGYEPSATNIQTLSLAQDGAFRDDASLQLMTVTGAIGANLTSSLTIAVV